MTLYIIFSIVASGAIYLLVYLYRRDRRYERLKVSDAMGDNVWEEIEKERRELMEKKLKFDSALSKAKDDFSLSEDKK